jgi:hypothetical protein
MVNVIEIIGLIVNNSEDSLGELYELKK